VEVGDDCLGFLLIGDVIEAVRDCLFDVFKPVDLVLIDANDHPQVDLIAAVLLYAVLEVGNPVIQF
jgi:hypothetical protein